MEIPEFFKQWLQSLTREQAKIMLVYFDGYIGETEALLLCETNPGIEKEV